MAMELVEASDISNVVNKSVESLQELALLVRKKKNFAGNDYDASNIEVIIEALHEMDRDRLKLHEMLESETITASALRYKLHRLPLQVKDEIQDAVLAARDSNETEIQRLKDNLDGINLNIDRLEARNKELLGENSRLEPERNQFLNEHEAVVALLNQKMADKASKQIMLNETRDTLRDTNKMIIQLEDSVVHLKEDLELEREEAVEEKKRLQKAVEDTRTKVDEQKKANEKQGSEIDSLQKELVDSEAALDAKRRVIRRFETSRAKLEAQVVQLSRQLQKEIKGNSALTQEGMKIMKLHQEMQAKLGDMQEELEDKFLTAQDMLASAKSENEKLNSKKEQVDKDYDDISTECEKLKDQVKEIEQRLGRARDQLETKNADCSRVRDENFELEEDIKQLQESHKAMTDSYNKRIEELKSLLKGERRERTSLQSKRDDVSKEAGEFKQEYSAYMGKMSDAVQNAKREHAQLTQRGNELQRMLKDYEYDIMEKQTLLKNGKQSYAEVQKNLRDELGKLQDSIKKLEIDVAERKITLAEKTPAFEALEQEFDESSKDFDALKKSIVDLKNKKAALELSIKRVNKEMEKKSAPRKRLEDELKNLRAEALRVMAEQNQEVKSIEKQNISCCQKLRTVVKENQRFVEAIKRVQEETRLLQEKGVTNESHQVKLNQVLSEYRADLLTARIEDLELDKSFAERDLKILDDIERLQDETNSRETKVDGIYVQLQKQLGLLASFIDGVANLRHKETGATTSKPHVTT